MAVAITRDDLSASDLRQAAARCGDSAQARRALALALVLEGKSRTEAARSAGMDRQTLRDWVHRYNTSGLEGLRNRPNLGAPPRKLSAEQEQQVAAWAGSGAPQGGALALDRPARRDCPQVWRAVARALESVHNSVCGA
jgi:transposase